MTPLSLFSLMSLFSLQKIPCHFCLLYPPFGILFSDAGNHTASFPASHPCSSHMSLFAFVLLLPTPELSFSAVIPKGKKKKLSMTAYTSLYVLNRTLLASIIPNKINLTEFKMFNNELHAVTLHFQNAIFLHGLK